MNHALDNRHSNQSEVHWKLILAARENSIRYAVWLARCDSRSVEWNKRAVKYREASKRKHIRRWYVARTV